MSAPSRLASIRAGGIGLARKEDARRRLGIDQEPIALELEMSPLLAAVPGFIPGNIDGRDEVGAFHAIHACIREHRLVQRGPCRVAHASGAIVSRGQHHAAPLGREDQIAPGMRPEDILRFLVFADHLPGDELPDARETGLALLQSGRYLDRVAWAGGEPTTGNSWMTPLSSSRVSGRKLWSNSRTKYKTLWLSKKGSV